MKKIVIIFLLTGYFVNASAQQYTINGKVKGLQDGIKIYIRDILNQQIIDSTVSKKETFAVKGTLPDEHAVLWIQFSQDKKMYYTTVLIGRETMKINASLNDFPHGVYSGGSPTDAVHNILKKATSRYWIERDSIVDEIFSPEMQNDSLEAVKTKRKLLIKRMNGIDKAVDSITVDFLLKHANSFAGINQLFYSRRFFSRDSLIMLFEKVSPSLQQSTYGQMIATYIKVGNVLKKGDDYFDFVSMDKEGKKYKLSDFRGNYILLDFATTYCGPCIESVAELKEEQSKYTGKLVIITVNADKSKEVWLKGHERDKPTWLSVWDGKGAAGEAVLKYGANGWPTFVLISPEGKIITRISGYGKGTIESLLKNNIH